MKRPDVILWRQVIDELANALQVDVGLMSLSAGGSIASGVISNT
jgi:hypothetical protein